MIILEAPTVTIAGRLAVNGGGGGTNDSSGAHATLDQSAAPGGTSVIGNGGSGGVGATLNGGNAGGGAFGGGGGAVGRIRIYTRTGVSTVEAGSMMSPALDDVPTTATEGKASIE